MTWPWAELGPRWFNAEEIIGKIPILPRGDPGPSGDDKIDSAKAFTKGGSLNVEGKAAWDDHRRRQAETLAFLNQSAEQPVEHPRAISGGGALDQPGQEFGAIMLTRKPHASEVAAWPVDWRQALT